MLGHEEINILMKSPARNSILHIFSSRPHGKILDCISHRKAKTVCIKSLDNMPIQGSDFG